MPGWHQRLKGLGRWPTLIFWALFTRALARCLLIGTATARQGKPMKTPSDIVASSLRRQAADTLQRARKSPPGPYRNDLRQLGRELVRLYRLGLRKNVQIVRDGRSSRPPS
jgi:hypothetical protein